GILRGAEALDAEVAELHVLLPVILQEEAARMDGAIHRPGLVLAVLVGLLIFRGALLVLEQAHAVAVVGAMAVVGDDARLVEAAFLAAPVGGVVGVLAVGQQGMHLVVAAGGGQQGLPFAGVAGVAQLVFRGGGVVLRAHGDLVV